MCCAMLICRFWDDFMKIWGTTPVNVSPFKVTNTSEQDEAAALAVADRVSALVL